MIIEFLRENILWLKDLFTLLFVGTGTIIAILTYRRARATILQPIRTEVIKKQSEILSKLLQILKENNRIYEGGLDYVTIVKGNTLLTLRDYGFVFSEHKETIEKIEYDIVGWRPCGDSKVLKDIAVIRIFKEEDVVEEAKNYGVEKFNNLKKGEINIDKIYLTKKHVDFTKEISEFKDDPFMPTSIQNILIEWLNDIGSNLEIILKSELENFMLEFSKEYFEKNKAPLFDPIGIYNSFNHSRVHHNQTLKKLRAEIRKHLKIDENW